ncbi:MAG: indole-3-glycerol-phosphate synthase [Saprospiraceae bacterium]|nr:indole-3-glycerol-phosphate synthase [Saprospiraceae bacterium]
MNILDKIVKRKLEEVALKKSKCKETQLFDKELFKRDSYLMSEYIVNPDLSGIVAEFKRKSPSKPEINLFSDISAVSSGYASAGASCISVLTDFDFFGGSDYDLQQARESTNIPILRKDFIIDAYQIIEAKSLGADVILLIAEILTKSQVNDLSKIAVDCGLEVLLEIHTSDQIIKYHERIKNIGVNNRNLKNFTTDIRYSKEIYHQLPKEAIKLSESGIDKPESVVELKRIGFNGFLIGENFMKTSEPANACKLFIQEVNQLL